LSEELVMKDSSKTISQKKQKKQNEVLLESEEKY
jgi:hypothetical protein